MRGIRRDQSICAKLYTTRGCSASRRDDRRIIQCCIFAEFSIFLFMSDESFSRCAIYHKNVWLIKSPNYNYTEIERTEDHRGAFKMVDKTRTRTQTKHLQHQSAFIIQNTLNKKRHFEILINTTLSISAYSTRSFDWIPTIRFVRGQAKNRRSLPHLSPDTNFSLYLCTLYVCRGPNASTPLNANT